MSAAAAADDVTIEMEEPPREADESKLVDTPAEDEPSSATHAGDVHRALAGDPPHGDGEAAGSASASGARRGRRRSSVSAHMLWGGRLNSWKGTAWHKRRSVFRIVLLVVLVGAAVVWASLGVGGGPEVSTATASWTAAELEGRSMRFELDKCELSVRADAGAAAVTATVRYAPGDGVRPSAIDSDTEAGFVVVDTRALGSRYLGGYRCRVDVRVPDGLELPDTRVLLRGHQSSAVTSEGVRYASFDLDVRHSRTTRVSAYLLGFHADALRLAFERGLVFVDGSVGAAGVSVVAPLPTASVYLRLSHDVEVRYDPNNPDAQVCLTGGNATCAGTDCTLVYDAASPPAAGAALPVVASTGSPYIQVMATEAAEPGRTPPLLDDYAFVDATVTLPTSNFAPDSRVLPSLEPSADLVRGAAGADVAQYRVEGPGSPPFLWQHSDVYFYLVVPPAFLDLFSWGLLTPSVRAVNVTLQGSFCPGLHLLGVTPGREAGEPYPLFENGLVVRNELARVLDKDFSRLVFSPEDSAYSWNGDKMTYERAGDAGEFVVRDVRLSTEANILATIVLGVVVATLGAGWVVYLAAVRLPRWAARQLDDWGYAYYGDDAWEARRDDTLRRASVFFWSEFLVGTPGEVRNYCRVSLTVLVHLAVVCLPVLPVAVGLSIFYSDGLNAADSQWFSVAALAATIGCFAYVGFSLVVLVAYYLDHMENTLLRLFVRSQSYLAVFVSFLSIVYLVQVFFWILLGIAVKPNTVLPVAAVFVVVALSVWGTVTRVRALHDQLQERIDENGEAVNAVPAKARDDAPPETYRVENIKKLSLKDVLAVVRKSEILEVAGQSLWESVVREIVTLLMLLSLLAFLGVGFFVLSTDTAFVSGLTTAAVFIVGGGVNIPLGTGRGKKAAAASTNRFEERVRQRAERAIEKEDKKDA